MVFAGFVLKSFEHIFLNLCAMLQFYSFGSTALKPPFMLKHPFKGTFFKYTFIPLCDRSVLGLLRAWKFRLCRRSCRNLLLRGMCILGMWGQLPGQSRLGSQFLASWSHNQVMPRSKLPVHATPQKRSNGWRRPRQRGHLPWNLWSGPFRMILKRLRVPQMMEVHWSFQMDVNPNEQHHWLRWRLCLHRPLLPPARNRVETFGYASKPLNSRI